MALANKTFQDLITFTRSTSGSYVGSDGYLVTSTPVANYLTYSNQLENGVWTKSNSFIQTNLLRYSEQFDNAAVWITNASTVAANSIIAPNGTLTADTLTANAGTGVVPRIADNSFNTVTNTPYTASLYVRAGTYTFFQIYILNQGSDWVNYTLSGGGTATANGACTATITALTNGWYRVTMSYTALSTDRVPFFMLAASGSATRAQSWNPVGTESVYIWGAQFVQGSVPGDYQATTATTLPVLYPDYNGARRARKLCEDATAAVQHRINQTTAFVGGSGTYFIKAKAGERQYVSLRTNTLGAVFDLNSGAYVLSGAGVTASVQNLGTGWWLCAITNPAAAVNEICRVNIENAFTVASSYAGDGSSGIYIADAQLNDGSSALAYYETTNNATYIPRFDYDPVTRAAKGLLVEESRANLLTYSEQFNNTAWTAAITGASISSNVLIAPDNTQSADKLIENNANSTHNIVQTITYANQTYVFSVYVAKASERNAMVYMYTASGFAGAVLNVANGTASIFSGSIAGTGATVVDAGAYWRVSVAALMPAAVGSANIYTISGTAASYLGDGTSGIYLWGAQLEVGAFATSYIPTGISQVTRAGDLATVNTLLPWFNQAAGTIYSEFDAYGGTNLNRFYEFAGATSSNTINGFLGPSTVYMEWVTTGGAPQAQLNAAGSPTAVNKVGAAYKENDFAASLNGATPVTDAGGTIPVISTLYLGNSVTGSQQLNGHLRRITYYPSRLTNAQLQSITT